MEGLFVVAAVILGAPWVLGIVALVRASRLSRRVERLEEHVARAERNLAEAARAGLVSSPVEKTSASPSAAGERGVREADLGSRIAAAIASSTPTPTPTPSAAAAGSPPPLPPRPTSDTLEHRLVLGWFTRIGALVLLLGAAYFFKYAVDNAWIGPAGRIAIGGVVGVALLAFAERIRPRARPAYVQALQGTGVAILFATAYASHALYGLVPVGVAFAAVAVVALAAGALAMHGRSELVLALALAGGLLAPVVLSTGQDRPAALFGYLAVLGALALAASARLEFRIAPFLAMAGTLALFVGWYDKFFDTRPPPADLTSGGGAYAALAARAVPLAFALIFAAEWLGFWARVRGAASRLWADAWLVASLGLAHALPWLLLLDDARATAVVVIGMALLAAAALDRAERRELQPAFAALGAILVAISAGATLELRLTHAPGAAHASAHAWLAVACAWALVQLGIVAHAWRIRGEAPSVPRVVTAALATLGAAGFALALTNDTESILRASVVGAGGVAALALGASVLAEARARATVLLGAAIGLFAGAAALLLSGASITLVWAALGAVAAVLAARERDGWWLLGAGALFVACVLRLVAIDLEAPAAATSEFLVTAGASGALRPRFLLNARALALAGTAIALLVAAVRCARVEGPFRTAAAVFATAGHGLLVALAVLEARGLALRLPAPPPVGDTTAFEAYRPAFWSAIALQAGRLDTVTTLTLGVCAALLVAIGFAARQVLQRWLGLALFAATLAKVLLFDVWRLSRLQQIAVFLAVGALMLAAAFLYARFGARLIGAFSDRPRGGTGRPGAALLALLAAGGVGAATPARALDGHAFREVRAVEGVTAPGLWAFEVDADLYRHSRAAPGTLGDVRLEAPGGAEVPWALRDVAPAEPEVVHDAVVVDPSVFPDGKVRAVLDLGRAGERHEEVRLALEGDDFLRPVRVESSGDGKRFGVIAEGGRVYAVRGVTEARRTWIRIPPSDARWLRVTLLPGAGAPPRIVGAQAVRGVARDPVMRTLDAGAPAARRPDARTSVFDVDLGAPGLPVSAVELEVGTTSFERRVRLLASTDGTYWTPVGGGVVWRALPGAKGEREDLRVEGVTGGRRWLRIEVADGDAAPLDVRRVHVAWRAQDVVFRTETSGSHRLHVGSEDAAAPAYDLAAALVRSPGAPVGRATLGPIAANPGFAPVEPERPFTERHKAVLGAALAALFAGLAVWAVRLLKRSASPSA